MKSEFVTQDERFGYIYRYDTVYSAVDDGRFHPESGTKGMVFKFKSKLIIYTLDCIHLKIIGLPGRLMGIPPWVTKKH